MKDLLIEKMKDLQDLRVSQSFCRTRFTDKLNVMSNLFSFQIINVGEAICTLKIYFEHLYFLKKFNYKNMLNVLYNYW